MKHLLYILAFGSLSPIVGFAQESATPPPTSTPGIPTPPVRTNASPVPLPPPPRPPQGRTQSGSFLGVEVTTIPAVLSDQLNLPDGFCVLVEYVVPGSAANTAGVKAHDILKMLNDQIVTSAEHLAALVRSVPEGQEVTLVVLHKGQETKLKATLQKRASRDADRDEEGRVRHMRTEHVYERDGSFSFNNNEFPNADYAEKLHAEKLRKGMERNRTQIETSTARALEQARQELEDARKQTARAAGTRLDFDRTHVVLRDSAGRVELSVAGGRRYLKVRDEQGKVILEGPIDRPEQCKKIPADILPKVEALERERDTIFPKDADDADDDHQHRGAS